MNIVYPFARKAIQTFEDVKHAFSKWLLPNETFYLKQIPTTSV